MRTESKTTRARRKLRALRDAQRRRQAASTERVSALAPALGQITNALAAAAAGYELCARRTADENVAVAVTNAATSLKSLVASMVREAASFGIDVTPRARTADRMRWEWLASTGVVMEGRSDARLLDECVRILNGIVGLDVSPLGESYASKVRLASAEAWSIAAALEPRRGAALAAIV